MRTLVLSLVVASLGISGVVALWGPSATTARSESSPGPSPTYTVQGDSLQAPTREYFLEDSPDWELVSFSAKGGRKSPEALRLLRRQQLGEVVIFNLGTNDWLRSVDDYKRVFYKVVELIGEDRCLVSATVYDHGPVGEINQFLRERAQQLGPERMQLVGWSEAVESGQVRLADGVHPSLSQGHRFRTRLIMEAADRCLEARDAA